MKEEIIQEIKSLCFEKNEKQYIDCKKVFELAEKSDISLSDLSKILNEEKIKVNSCQLGCF